MGTDVYLEWKGKTEEEAKKQQTGFSINAGDVGYMRASIAMVNENAVLRMLFPGNYWVEHSRDEYDFKGHYEVLDGLGWKYLLCATGGKRMEVSEEVEVALKQQGATAAVVLAALSKAVEDKEGAIVGFCRIAGFGSAVAWLNSLYKFFELGIEKQEKGLKPYPYISW